MYTVGFLLMGSGFALAMRGILRPTFGDALRHWVGGYALVILGAYLAST